MSEVQGVSGGLNQLALVSLAHSIVVAGKALPQGATGTVISTANGVSEVAFEKPFHAVISIQQVDIVA
jgi:hypothetical protein